MRCGAVIVAAGLSTRLKQLKQLTKIGNINLAERVLVNLRKAGVSDIVMVTDSNAGKIEKALKKYDIEFIRREDCEIRSMFESAGPGLACLKGRCERIFLSPVDVPFFTDRTLSGEMAAMDGDPSVKMVVPVCRGKEGYPLLIRENALAGILACSGEAGLKEVCPALAEGAVLKLDTDDEGIIPCTVAKNVIADTGVGSAADESGNESALADTYTRIDFRKLADIHNEKILHPEIKLMLASTSSFFGPGAAELLKEIQQCGNVKDACERCGFSYSKGWKIIKGCEEKYGHSVVERQPGGQTGGTAGVTEAGQGLLAAYEELETSLAEFAEEKFRKLMKKYRLTGEGGKMCFESCKIAPDHGDDSD